MLGPVLYIEMLRLLALSCCLVSLQAAPANQYVDAKKCAVCHPQIAANYRLTGMSRSLYRPSPANTVEDYKNNPEFLHSLSDTHYAMIQRDGVYYQRRWQIGFGGKETNVEELKIDYVIGSGTHARSYLHRMASGAFIELPLGWYQEKGGYWGMSPGFDSRHPQTRRFISYECAFCHTAIPKIPEGHDAPGSDPVFTGDLPEGIDCQRCHGPGGNHVRLMQTSGVKPEAIRASIVNPARLSPKLQMDICMQCHLEPTSGELPALIRRFNRGPFAFMPGEPLSNFLLVFDHATGTGHDDKFEIVGSSAYRLRQSQCFLKSNGAMTCQTCHDPHQIPRGNAAVTYYAAACRQCHAAAFDAKVAAGQHTASNECVTCHMPKRRTDDVVHVAMTDHLIQRRLPARNLLADLPERHPTEAEQYHGEVVPYYPAPLPSTDENMLYRAVAQVALKNNLQEGIAELTRETARVEPREAEFYMVLGAAQQSNGKPREAVAAYQHALRLRPDFPRGLLSLASALKAALQMPAAEDVLKRTTQIAPTNATAWFQYGTVDYALGRIDGAIEKMEKAIALDPELPGEHTGLAEILAGTGKLDRAETALKEALRIDPYDATAYDLTGRVLAGKGELTEALYDFENATRLRPGYGPHLYDYGLALLSTNRFDDAQASAEAAVQAAPNMAEAHELLGGLLARKRQFSEAAREYREALRLRPDFDRAHLDLASVLAAQGDMPGAMQQLREAAKGRDPRVAQQAAAALQRLGER
ncbi:MAG TPA: tetratricopeptide repeat protein [Bryobacteraceae bacterium]